MGRFILIVRPKSGITFPMEIAQDQLPLRDYIGPFLDHCEVERGHSAATQRNYRAYLGLFERWLDQTETPELLPMDLTADHIWAYRLYLARDHGGPQDRPLAKKSQNFYLIALRQLLDFLSLRGVIALPSSAIALAKQPENAPAGHLELDEIGALLAAPDTESQAGLRDRAILELLFSAGIRIAELVALDRARLAPVLSLMALEGETGEMSITGKGGRVRTIYISPRAAIWLGRYLASRDDEEPALFINLKSNRPEARRLTARAIQRMVARHAATAGIGHRVTPHTLRHTYATDLLSQGADLRSVQELLGHKNLATTQIYTHVKNRQLRDVHRRFHSGSD